mgnify:CR=1 FL=1
MLPEFRVWDIPKDEFAIGNDAAMSLNGLYVWLPDPSTGDFNLTFPGDYVIEQYTGLKDNNGNKIYEGDIVKMDRHGYNQPDTYAVKDFIRGKCVFQKVEVTDGSTMFQEASNGHDLTVIGNIHENPELLEVE